MRFKTMLNSGNCGIGTWCELPNADTIEILAKSGMNFVIIDLEHGPHGFETAAAMARGAQLYDCAALVRVPSNNPETILRALEIGSDGIVVPQISNVDAAREAVSAAKYYPDGNRGFSPFTRSGGYSSEGVENLAEIANERTLCVLLVEGVEGISNLDEILTVDGIDVIYIGTYDLCQSVGHPGQPNHPEVVKLLSACVRKINSAGKAAGCLAQSVDEVKRWIEMGIRFIPYKADCAILYDASRQIINDVQFENS